MNAPAPQRPARSLAAGALRASAWAVLLLVVALNTLPSAALVSKPYPLDPWNGPMTVEAARVSMGLPQYEDRVSGHATHCYGALASRALGWVFRWTGPGNAPARWVSWGAAFLLSAGVSLAAFRGAGAFWLLFGFAAVWSANLKTYNYFINARPDVCAALFATASAFLLCRAEVARRGALLRAAGVALLLVGFFLKQTAAMVALFPPVALALRFRQAPDGGRARAWVAALLPLAAVLGCLLVLRGFFPLAFHYMVVVARDQPIRVREILPNALGILVGMPLFVVALLDWARRVAAGEARLDRKLAWLLAAALVCVPASAVTWAKLGGAINSSLPALLALNVFALAWAREFVCGRAGAARRGAVALALALLVLASTVSQSSLYRRFLGGNRPLSRGGGAAALQETRRFHRGTLGRAAEYEAAIRVARDLPGKVLSPVDPTLVLLARGEVTRSLALEYDSLSWPNELPAYLRGEIEQADYVVEVLNTQYSDQVDARRLSAMGFVKTDLLGEAENYAVWRNGRKPSR
jgi:hypothetical protein